VKRWIQRLYTRDCRQWEHKLSKIDCEFLRVKVASIIFWDATSERSVPVRNSHPTYLKQLSRQWRPAYEAHYTEDDVMNALMDVAEYPKSGMNGAYRRSRKPKWSWEYICERKRHSK
jgi:hypothetical protein